MRRTLIPVFAAGLLCVAAPVFADSSRDAPFAALAVNAHPATVNEVHMTGDRTERYRELAERIGLEYGREYGYTEWVDTKRANDIGVAGSYEWLKCSTGEMGENELCPTDDASEVAMYWETMYYSNHDVTVLYRYRSPESGTYILLLKLAEGRVQDLHRR